MLIVQPFTDCILSAYLLCILLIFVFENIHNCFFEIQVWECFPRKEFKLIWGLRYFGEEGLGLGQLYVPTYSQILLIYVHYCPGEGTPKPKTTAAILQGGRLGAKRGVKAVQVEVFLPGTDDPPSLGRYPALCFVTRGCPSFGFVGLGIIIIAFIRMFQMYFEGEGDFEVANR